MVSEEKAGISTSLIFLLSTGVQQIPPLVSTLQLEWHSLKGPCLKVEVFMDTWGTDQGTTFPEEAAATVFLAKGLKEVTGTPQVWDFLAVSCHWTVEGT